jgi:hypothetical protein
MKTIRIFVEGKSDNNFLPVYLKHILGVDKLPDFVEIIPTGGVTNLHLEENKFIENTDIGGINLVIFDTDSPEKDFGGFEARTKYLQNKKQELNIIFEQFLLPNDEIDGNLETLLENIAAKEHQKMMQCFDKYETCVKGFLDKNGKYVYNIPAKKSKIYTYVESLKKSKSEEKRFNGDENGKDKDFLFDNSTFWDLENENLKPLKTFLLKYIVGKMADKLTK